MVREGSPYTGFTTKSYTTHISTQTCAHSRAFLLTLILGGEALILGSEALILFKANLGRLFKLAVLLHGDAARAPLQNLVLSVVWR